MRTFTQKQKSVITGSLLGDGHLVKPKYGHSAMTKGQCNAHLEYLNWHLTIFGSSAGPIRSYDNWANGKLYRKNMLRVKSHPFLSQLRQEWYPHGTKIVPSNIQLDPVAIATWYADDGTCHNGLAASFATYSFTTQEVNLLASILLDNFSIKCRIAKHNVLHVRPESYRAFLDIIRPHMIWNCFQHKVLLREPVQRGLHPDDIPSVVKKYVDGEGITSIAANMGVSTSHVSTTIRNKLAHNGLPLNNTSGIKGVCWDKSRNRWVASYRKDGKTIRLGRFKTKEEAAQAIRAASF